MPLSLGFFSLRLTLSSSQISSSQTSWLSQSSESLLSNLKLVSHSVFSFQKAFPELSRKMVRNELYLQACIHVSMEPLQLWSRR